MTWRCGVVAAALLAIVATRMGEAAPILKGMYAPARGKVHLSFDDGPNAKNGKVLLDQLLSRDAQATLFYVGGNLVSKLEGGDSDPGVREEIRRALREGHAIGSHTYDHENLGSIAGNTEKLIEQIVKVEDKVKELTGTRTYLFRAPYGNLPPSVHDFLNGRGYSVIHWNIDSGDWRLQTGDQVIQSLKGNGQLAKGGSGGIILMHEGEGTCSAQAKLVDHLRSRDLQVVPVTHFMPPEVRHDMIQRYRCSKYRLRTDGEFHDLYTKWCTQLADNEDINTLPEFIPDPDASAEENAHHASIAETLKDKPLPPHPPPRPLTLEECLQARKENRLIDPYSITATGTTTATAMSTTAPLQHNQPVRVPAPQQPPPLVQTPTAAVDAPPPPPAAAVVAAATAAAHTEHIVRKQREAQAKQRDSDDRIARLEQTTEQLRQNVRALVEASQSRTRYMVYFAAAFALQAVALLLGRLGCCGCVSGSATRKKAHHVV